MADYRIEVKPSKGSTQWDDPHYVTIESVVGSENMFTSEQYPSKGNAKRAGKRLREITGWDLVVVDSDGVQTPVPLDDTQDET